MKNNNKGFTLIELIVVICILGIFTTIVATSISPTYTARAKSCTTKTDDLITKCRMGCLSRSGDVYLLIHVVDGNIVGEYYEDGTLVSRDILSDKSVSMSYTIGSTPPYNLTTYPLKLSFKRSTGSLNTQPVDFAGSGGYCKSIEITCYSKSYTINFTQSTGTHIIS